MSTRMPSADTAWLHMDRPTNLMVINSISLFDAPADWERHEAVIQRRLVDRYPRFRQRVVESRLPLRPPRWEDDPEFALEHHVHRITLPPPGDVATLQELVGDVMTMPLDRDRPLWQIFLVDGVGEGAATITRVHHCIADGVALARVMLSLTDSRPDGGIEPLEPETAEDPPGGLLGGLVGQGARLVEGAAQAAATVGRQGLHVATSPAHAASLAGAVARDGATALKLLLTPADAATALKGDPGISRRVSWTSPIPLSDIKRIAHANDATVNDVVLAAVSGALRHYLQERQSPVAEIQALVPFNLRPLDEPVPRALGNKFGLVFLPLPVGTSGSYRRLMQVHERMRELKEGREGPVSYGLLSVTGMAPERVERKVVDLLTGKGTAVMTNVPGPRETVYLAGAPIRSALFWAPTSGHIGMSVSIFSYRGEVTVGLMVDAALVPDPGEIVLLFEWEIEALGRLHRPRPGRRTSAGRRAEQARSGAGNGTARQ